MDYIRGCYMVCVPLVFVRISLRGLYRTNLRESATDAYLAFFHTILIMFPFLCLAPCTFGAIAFRYLLPCSFPTARPQYLHKSRYPLKRIPRSTPSASSPPDIIALISYSPHPSHRLDTLLSSSANHHLQNHLQFCK